MRYLTVESPVRTVVSSTPLASAIAPTNVHGILGLASLSDFFSEICRSWAKARNFPKVVGWAEKPQPKSELTYPAGSTKPWSAKCTNCNVGPNLQNVSICILGRPNLQIACCDTQSADCERRVRVCTFFRRRRRTAAFCTLRHVCHVIATSKQTMATDEHRRLFEERMAKTLDDPDRRHNSPFLSKEQYDAILGTVCGWATLTREARKALGSKAYAYIYIYMHTCIRTHIHTCMCIYVCIYIHIYMHAYMHTYIHTYIHT